jgi:AcrR family transcriptional regulator
VFSFKWILALVKLLFAMQTVDRRARRKEQLRQKILETSRSILVNEGFEALTMRRVAEAIDYAPASIYLHFESREQIAQELCFAGLIRLRDDLKAVSASDPAATLKALGRAYLHFAQSNPETYRLIFMADPKLTQAVFYRERDKAGPSSESLDLIAGVLAELRKGKRPPTLNLRERAELFWAGLHGIASLRLACAQGLTSDDLVLGDAFARAVSQIA